MIDKRYSVLVCLVLFIMGCQRDIYNFTNGFEVPQVSKEPPLVQFVVDEQIPDNLEEASNLQKLTDYTKLPYQPIPFYDFKDGFKVAPSTRILCIYQTSGMKDAVIDSLQRFVAKGGTLLFTKTVRDERLAFLLGLDPSSTLETDSIALGFDLKRPMLPGMGNFKYEGDKSEHNGLAKDNFSEEVTIYASAANAPDYPLIIENKVGKGRVIHYNSTLLLDRGMRGLLFAQVLFGLEGIPYPIANTSTIFLDDFPSPLYNIYKAPVAEEMKKNVAQYVTDVWWPDMKAYAKEQNISYTAYVTFDYNAYVTPPFTFKEWDKNSFKKDGIEQEKSSWLGRDVYQSGHELGFHGYNHVSLLQSDWKEEQYIVTALNAASKKWKTLDFKELPISYVPPSNYIDSVGLAKLKEGMPSVKYIQSLYLGNLHEGGAREFDPDPFNDKFFDYPRITSGYQLNNTNLWALESLYLFTGIWTHFVHPDDVFQIPDKSNEATSGHFAYRNPAALNWHSYGDKKGLFDLFKDDIKSFKERHPLVRFQNATRSSDIVRDWRYAYFNHVKEEGDYIVESDFKIGNEAKQYWFLYASAENESLVEDALDTASKVKKTPFLDGTLYSIETKEAFVKIPDLKIKGKGTLTTDAQALYQVHKAQQAYYGNRNVLAPLNQQVAALIAEDKLKEATDLLETNLENGAPFGRKQWVDFATYLGWQDRNTHIWKVLEKQYLKKESKKLANISRKVSEKVDYPNDQVRETWLSRQILWGTDDIGVLKEYYTYFNTLERKSTVLKALRQLHLLEPTNENSKNYIRHLIHNEFDGVVPELNNIAPCDPFYTDMSTAIAWAYADRLRFDRALLWEKCSNEIDQETKNSWLVNTHSFEELKETDYQFYLQVLLANDEKKALREIRSKKPCSPQLREHSKEIAFAYANFKLYREALAWGHCSKAVPMTSKLSWLYELKEYQKANRVYEAYISKYPEDYPTKLHMATLLLQQGDIKGSASISSGLPKEVETGMLRAEINKQIKSISSIEKRAIVDAYSNVLYSETRKDVLSALRMEEGNSISTNTMAINDQLDPNTISSSISYSIYDDNFNVHSFSGTQSFMYPINFIPEDEINGSRTLYGIEYRFKQPASKKVAFLGRARLERDIQSKVYYQIGAGINLSGEKRYNSMILEHFPVRSGPGHILGIYRTQLTSYNEYQVTDKTKQIISFEGNHYSDSESDAIMIGRTEYQVYKNNWCSLSPMIELSYARGTTDRRDGFPYWMAADRVYGGGGIAFMLGSEQSAFHLMADASLFAESNQPNFQRYTGNLSYKIKDFARVLAGFEVYTIENFNSNVFQLGLVYNFK